MQIILNILAHGPCAQFHAIADDDEPPFINEYGVSTRNIKFWHNAQMRALCFDSAPDVHDNDKYITFHSDLPFAEFCKILEYSEYNDPRKYSLINHNCAHGSAFALHTAGIELNVPDHIPLNRMGTHLVDHLPAFSLSPLDLYAIALEHKKKMLQESNAGQRYELAKQGLFAAVRKTRNKEKKARIRHLVEVDEKFLAAHPEHIEMHIQVLLQTIELLTAPTADKMRDYQLLKSYHFDRFQHPGVLRPLTLSCQFSTLLMLGGALQTMLERTELIEPLYENSLQNRLIGAGVGAGLGMALFLYSYLSEPEDYHTKTTELTKAMTDVINNDVQCKNEISTRYYRMVPK